jgi:uncharacterized protein (TIGR02246 family)
MLTCRALALLALLAPALSACQPRSAALTDADRNAIRAVSDKFVKAALAGDWAAAASAYTEDGMALPPNGPAVRGRAAIQNWLATFPRITAFTDSIVEIGGRGDFAYTQGTYEVTVMPPGAKEPMRDTGKNVAVLEKQRDGSWLVLRGIWNSDLPLAR